MPIVSVADAFASPLTMAERLWYDTDRWAEWVAGLEAVTGVDLGWPGTPGTRVSWRSGPAGRGAVTERVLEQTPGAGQRVAVADDSIEGEQTIAFAPAADGVRLTLTLAYRLRRRNPLTAVIDLLFIRRAMAEALADTLERFGDALRS